MGTTQRPNRRVERYIQQIQSSKDNKVPTSWSDFIDTVIIGSGLVCGAGIYSLDSGQKWASQALEVNKDEILKLVEAFTDPTPIYEKGIHLENKKYCFLSAQANAITARNCDQTVTIAKCRTCVLIGVHQHKVNSNTAHNIIVKLANYLSEQKL